MEARVAILFLPAETRGLRNYKKVSLQACKNAITPSTWDRKEGKRISGFFLQFLKAGQLGHPGRQQRDGNSCPLPSDRSIDSSDVCLFSSSFPAAFQNPKRAPGIWGMPVACPRGPRPRVQGGTRYTKYLKPGVFYKAKLALRHKLVEGKAPWHEEEDFIAFESCFILYGRGYQYTGIQCT